MTSLVVRFKTDLDISHKEAKGKVIWFFSILTCMVLTVGIPLKFFPQESRYIQTISVLYGNHQQVEQIHGGEVLLGSNDFGNMLDKAEPSFMAVHEDHIDYMTKVDGVSYQYVQQVERNANYMIYSSYVKDDRLVRDMRRNVRPIVGFVVLPILLVIIFASAIDSILTKEELGPGGMKIRRKVWRN